MMNHLWNDMLHVMVQRPENPMPCDHYETEDLHVMSFDVPGIAREDLQIEVEGPSLLVRGERKRESRSGPRISSFRQRIHLPEQVTADHIAADLKDGVLRIAIQKPLAQRPVKIKIGDGTAQGFLKNLLGKDKKSSETVTLSA